MKRLTINLT